MVLTTPNCIGAAICGLTMLVVLAPPASPAAPESAQAFAQRLVRELNSSERAATMLGWPLDRSLTQLMDENSRLAGAGNVDLLDYDSVCQCQDIGQRYRLISVRMRSGDEMDVRIRHVSPGEDRPYTLVIRRTGTPWLIYDIINNDGGLRAQLERHNACMRTKHNDAAVVRCFNGH